MVIPNSRIKLQHLFNECSEASGKKELGICKSISMLVLEDKEYAEGFFANSLSRMLRYISPTLGRDEGREFIIQTRVLPKDGMFSLVVGLSFLPKVEDDVSGLVDFLGEELVALLKLKHFNHFVSNVAINGKIVV